ncbi:MAG: DUF3017 domain-containing protein [Actinomycetia bacterium]|jgi:hypothetical protein|nr:DUF3017 domain-containing protein [Actinomycetes bacterium]
MTLGVLSRQWAVLVVLAGVAAGLLLVVLLEGFRVGSLLTGASVVLAAWLRALLPAERLGVLVVRSRRFDVGSLALLGLGITVLAFVVPPPS